MRRRQALLPRCFAIMTKVGVYAILRVFALIFAPAAATGDLAQSWLPPLAMATLVIGAIGVLGCTVAWPARRIGDRRLGWNDADCPRGLHPPQTTAAALYYMIHSTLACALLFLVVDLVRSRRPDRDDRLVALRRQSRRVVSCRLSILASAIGVAGLPPLSGFIGKLLILSGVRGTEVRLDGLGDHPRHVACARRRLCPCR